MSIGNPQQHGQINRIGGGTFLGVLQFNYGPDDVNDIFVGPSTRRVEVYGDPPPPPSAQLMKINMCAAPNAGWWIEWFPGTIGGGCEATSCTGIVTLPANVAKAILGAQLATLNRDWKQGMPNGEGYSWNYVVAFVEYVDQPDPPPPFDGLHVIGIAGGSTEIKVLIGDPINPIDVVSITLSEDYQQLSGYPRPVSTPAGISLPNGGTYDFYRSEAAAIVAASAGSYA